MISKTDKNHLIPLDYEEKRFATNNELLIDKETDDLYAVDKDGNLINFYDQYLSRLEDDEVIKRHTIYGISIDMSNPDTEGSVTYISRSKKFTPLTVDPSTGICDYGSWKDIITDFLGVKPCIFSDKVEAYLNPEDYSKTIDGNDASNYTGNVMIEFRKLYYKFSIEGDKLLFKVSDVNTDGSYIDNAFLIDSENYSTTNDFMYIASYPSSKDASGAIKSIAGVAPYIATGTLSDLLYEIESAGSRQTILGYNRYLYLLGLSWLITKSTDISLFGTGTEAYISGTLSDKGLFYGTKNGPNKIFGIENLFTGLPQLCAGILSRDGIVYSLSHGPYKNINIAQNTSIAMNIPDNEIVIGYASEYEKCPITGIIFPKDLTLDLQSIDHFKGICIYVKDFTQRYAIINNGGIQFLDISQPLVECITRLTYC